MEGRNGNFDAVIVGGGLAGLAAAAAISKAGCSVALLERSDLGGRAATQQKNGHFLNFGPHALYRKGAAARILRELGVSWSGGVPAVSGAYALHEGRKDALPGGFVSLVSTGLFGVAAKIETARFLAGLPKLDPRGFDGQTIRHFLDAEVRHAESRQLVEALFRLSTYSNDPERASAGAALAQVQLALSSGVEYLDGGWQTLVDGLLAVATKAGAAVVAGARVVALESAAGGWTVRLRDGRTLAAPSVVLAVPPEEAVAVTGRSAPLQRAAKGLVPVRAACLDLGLSKLPVPKARFALGIDRPLYLSVHSAVAKLAPAGAATLHVAKYLGGAAADASGDRAELERALDLVQPGWRNAVVEQRFLPDMIVANALPLAAAGGLSGRPAIDVAEAPGLFVAGDWIGGEGLLADASLASAKAAATAILARGKSRAAA